MTCRRRHDPYARRAEETGNGQRRQSPSEPGSGAIDLSPSEFESVEDAYAHLTGDWQRLTERILAEDLDDRSRWGEPIQDDPLAHLRRALDA